MIGSHLRWLLDLSAVMGMGDSNRSVWTTAAGRVVWVAGVAVSEDFRLGPQAREVAVLTARVLD